MSKTIQEPLLYDVASAARAAGVSSRTIRRLIADGELPTVRVGLLVRIRLADLQSYIDAHRSEVNA
ncbi:helix-turn-helix domain-containing protein [Microbacterium aerolatum]|uniref:Helix-turn-helix domain-containing protein n=1 Tax=Microbacterium aerolatum TaxID=153731 RepID=A0A511AF88_9MICO|nr:helix-turn-helix domain-containing protein [Microbacterium aerolatum]GEK86810.1 hypothetical protein MAE01_19860 [Microbacterium aerolatum]GGB24904.1 hypothetical protein GCM10007198_14090 [Microbacterium aerolatum]